MKTHAIIFTLGLLLGLFFSFMYGTLLIDLPKPTVSRKSVVDIKKEVANTEAAFAKDFDSLNKQSSTLQSELSNTKALLHRVKARNALLTTQVSSLIQKQKTTKSEVPDVDGPCDSLVSTVADLMQLNVENDSLSEAIATNLSAQVANKDSTIELKEKQYTYLKLSLDESLLNQQLLLDENKVLGKQVRRQKVKSKILSVALFIFSGAAINYLLRR